MVDKVPSVGSLSDDVRLTEVELVVVNRFTLDYPHGLREYEVAKLYSKIRKLIEPRGVSSFEEFKNILNKIPESLIIKIEPEEDKNGERVYYPILEKPINPKIEENVTILPLAN